MYALLMLVLAALPMEAGNPRGGDIRYNSDLYLSTSSSGKNGYGAMGAIEICHGIEIKRGSSIGIGTGATYSVFFDDFSLVSTKKIINRSLKILIVRGRFRSKRFSIVTLSVNQTVMHEGS